MTTVAQAIASAVVLPLDGRGRLQAPPGLQSWPGIVHGGAIVALLDQAALALGRPPAPRLVEGRLTASLPLETPLTLEALAHDDVVALTVRQDGHVLSSATVGPAPAAAPAAPWKGGDAGWPMPLSDDCLACGARNPIGLQVAPRFDEEGVWVRVLPRGAWKGAARTAHVALAPVIMDEVAWWLGALAMKEGGLTNRLSVVFHRSGPLPPGPLLAAGRFADVSPVDRRRTFWRTAIALSGPDGELLASASIVFRGGPEYSERQLAFFRPRTSPHIFARMFPGR